MRNLYDDIEIPENIDEFLDRGINKANRERKIKSRRKSIKAMGCIAASLAIAVSIGITKPSIATAESIPVIGNIFKLIQNNLTFSGEYSTNAKPICETASCNGIAVTLSEALCDGQSLYLTYQIKNEKPFKYTSLDNSNTLDVNQLVIAEDYNKVDFSEDNLNTSSFAGLEGKFIDNHTFIGVEKFKLNELKSDIPDSFTFETMITGIEKCSSKGCENSGQWAFKVPIKVNKNLKREITVQNDEDAAAKVNSLSITPYDMIVNLEYKEGSWSEYDFKIYDDNNNELKMSESKASDNLNENAIVKAPSSTCNSIRVVITRNSNLPILDKTINIK